MSKRPATDSVEEGRGDKIPRPEPTNVQVPITPVPCPEPLSRMDENSEERDPTVILNAVQSNGTEFLEGVSPSESVAHFVNEEPVATSEEVQPRLPSSSEEEGDGGEEDQADEPELTHTDIIDTLDELHPKSKAQLLMEALGEFGVDLVVSSEEEVDQLILTAAQFAPEWFRQTSEMYIQSSAEEIANELANDAPSTNQAAPTALPPGPTTGPGISADDPVELLDSSDDEPSVAENNQEENTDANQANEGQSHEVALWKYFESSMVIEFTRASNIYENRFSY